MCEAGVELASFCFMSKFDKLQRMCEEFGEYQFDTTGTMKNEDTLQDAIDTIEDILDNPTVTVEPSVTDNMVMTAPNLEEPLANDETTQIDLQNKPECPCGDAMAFALQLTAQLKLWHWQAKEHTVHEILGKMYDELDEELDKFVELVIGAYGICAEDYVVSELEPYQTKAQIIEVVEGWIGSLKDPSSVFADNTDIASVRRSEEHTSELQSPG